MPLISDRLFIFKFRKDFLIFFFFFLIILLFYHDIINLPFMEEDYVRILKHGEDFHNGLLEPLKTPPVFSLRYRPIGTLL